jgi:hypothetical protein
MGTLAVERAGILETWGYLLGRVAGLQPVAMPIETQGQGFLGLWPEPADLIRLPDPHGVNLFRPQLQDLVRRHIPQRILGVAYGREPLLHSRLARTPRLAIVFRAWRPIEALVLRWRCRDNRQSWTCVSGWGSASGVPWRKGGYTAP